MQFDRGYLSAYMSTDMDKMVAVLEEPLILITDKKISNIQEILPILEQVMQTGRKLLLDCRGRRKRGSGNSGCETSCVMYSPALR